MASRAELKGRSGCGVDLPSWGDRPCRLRGRLPGRGNGVEGSGSTQREGPGRAGAWICTFLHPAACFIDGAAEGQSEKSGGLFTDSLAPEPKAMGSPGHPDLSPKNKLKVIISAELNSWNHKPQLAKADSNCLFNNTSKSVYIIDNGLYYRFKKIVSLGWKPSNMSPNHMWAVHYSQPAF